MTILFTADIHIKLGQKNVPIEWSKNRYSSLFSQMLGIIDKHSVSTVIVGGDIFDRLPTLEELAIYFEFLMVMGSKPVEVIIYSGNHEALKKNTTFLTYLKGVTRATNDRAVIIDDYYSTSTYDIIPYNKLKHYVENQREPSNTTLFTHCRGEIPPHVQPEVELSIFEKWENVFAGDLHSHSNSQRNIVYPGSPVTTSFHRNLVDTGVVVIKGKEWEFVKLELPQLIRKTVSSTTDMLKTDYHHTIYELEGDMQEMSKIDNPDLLDKKIVSKDSVSSLGLRPEMTISEELGEYLKQVLLIDEDKTKLFVKKFNDYISNSEMG